jgi:hypothetical protein
MYKLLFKLIFFVTFFFSPTHANETPVLLGWTALESRDGLHFYSQQSQDGALLKFKAKGVLKVKMEKILAVLRNVERTTEWDKDTVIKQTIQDISDLEALTYSETKIPWPFQNRDLVLRNKLHISKEQKVLFVESNSEEHVNYPPRKKRVRAFLRAVLRIRLIDEETTNVEMEVLVDPKGSIPHWVVNIVQRRMPYDFLKSVESYARTSNIEPNAGVMAMAQELRALLADGKDNPAF